MDLVTRKVSGSAVAAFFAAGLFPAAAVAQQSTALAVGARVAPTCTIRVDPSTTRDADSSGVRVLCGRNGLRALRVSTDRGDVLHTFATLTGAQLRAGGEVAFVVAQPLATVASRLPVFAAPPAPGRSPVTVTLDF